MLRHDLDLPILGAVAVLIGLGVVWPPTADALPIIGDCKVPPMPAQPDAGMGGWILLSGPAPKDSNDPFPANANTSIVDH